MQITTSSRFTRYNQKIALVLISLVLLFGMLNVLQDLLESRIENSSYYFSESVLFSSFWWLFAPLLWVQYLGAKSKYTQKVKWKFVLISVPIVAHLIAYPALVWLLSRFFYYHTFEFQQTLNFVLSEYVYLLLLLYTVPFLLLVWIAKRREDAKTAMPSQEHFLPGDYATSLLVAEGNKKRTIDTGEILYILASPPYIAVHLAGKQYLLNESLKSMLPKLDPKKFVRVHKSTIVNIQKVDALVSRNNGDYDLTLENDVQLRVSRNFFANFKEQYNFFHRFTTK